MEFKGTRGCWKISKHSCFTVVSDENRSIATTGGYTDNTRAEQVHIENVANAQLISCAPEMLEMLEEVTEELCSCLKKLSEGGHDVDYQTVSESLELIKKATTI